jgi:protein SDA1
MKHKFSSAQLSHFPVQARVAAIKGGREEGKKFGGGKYDKKAEGASQTNKQKSKKKNFSMMKHKIKAKGKKSFREKQMALKKRLIKNAKFTVKL